MKIKHITLAGLIIFALSSLLLIKTDFSHVKDTPGINYYIAHPDVTYEVFSGCKVHVDDTDRCYAAWSAAVSLADSKSCSPEGMSLKHRFKYLVGRSTDKEECSNKELASH